ncbi:MAG TPA: hypothetical protein VMB27_19570 [Solirubrobacteraceae bacterium]|nr:hypothetical protein [Solirubrobacteraceae bacterium]
MPEQRLTPHARVPSDLDRVMAELGSGPTEVRVGRTGRRARTGGIADEVLTRLVGESHADAFEVIFDPHSRLPTPVNAEVST